MTGLTPPRSVTWQRFRRLPIFHRLLLGNSIIVVAGVVGGTLFVHYLASLRYDEDLWLIGLFAGLSVLLSLFFNYWIIRTALHPLHELREAVDRVQARRTGAQVPLTDDSDPDISRLAAAINLMLDRLDGRAVQLRALSERVIDAQEDERRQIARDLHDDIGQSLSTLIINIERLEKELATDAPKMQRQLAAARQLATHTLDDLRKVVYNLRPTILDDLGLAPAIRWYARSNLEGAGIQVRVDELDETVRLAPQLETVLFRIAQEAVNNILRHAQARSVTVSLYRQEGRLCLRVKDDGQGFDVAQITGQALRLRRFGLMGIQERAELVGGEAAIESAPGQGTCLSVSVPLLGMEASAPPPPG